MSKTPNGAGSAAGATGPVTTQDEGVAEGLRAGDAEAIAQRATEVTTNDATTLEDVQALAFKGESLPSGWAFNNVKGFHKTENEG